MAKAGVEREGVLVHGGLEALREVGLEDVARQDVLPDLRHGVEVSRWEKVERSPMPWRRRWSDGVGGAGRGAAGRGSSRSPGRRVDLRRVARARRSPARSRPSLPLRAAPGQAEGDDPRRPSGGPTQSPSRRSRARRREARDRRSGSGEGARARRRSRIRCSRRRRPGTAAIPAPGRSARPRSIPRTTPSASPRPAARCRAGGSRYRALAAHHDGGVGREKGGTPVAAGACRGRSYTADRRTGPRLRPGIRDALRGSTSGAISAHSPRAGRLAVPRPRLRAVNFTCSDLTSSGG